MNDRLLSLTGLLALSLGTLVFLFLITGMGMQLVVGLSIGIGFGSALTAVVTTACHSADRKRDRQQVERLIYEYSQQPEISYQTDPLLVEGLRQLTDLAVLNGECCFCGSDHPNLEADPYNPAFHGKNPLCRVPLCRALVEKYSVEPDPEPVAQRVTRQIYSEMEMEMEPTRRYLPTGHPNA